MESASEALATVQSVACDLRNIGDELWRVRSTRRRSHQRRPQERYTDMTILRNVSIVVCTLKLRYTSIIGVTSL